MRLRANALGFQVGGKGPYLKINQRDLIAELTSKLQASITVTYQVISNIYYDLS
jgi:hypothetical protein